MDTPNRKSVKKCHANNSWLNIVDQAIHSRRTHALKQGIIVRAVHKVVNQTTLQPEYSVK